MHSFGRKDKERVTRRMRLMPGDVEVTYAEGEVDRIEIFERGRKKRQVERDEGNRERAGS